MKKIIPVLAVWMMIGSCSKDVKAPADESAQGSIALKGDTYGGLKPVRANARIYRNGDEREGGIGWYMQVNAYEWEVPANLPDQYKVEGILVDVAYVPTDKPVPNYKAEQPKYLVQITDINKIKE